MRVGIDATAMPIRRTGAGNYIFNLVRSLSRVDRDNEYIVFAGSQQWRALDVDVANFSHVPVDLPRRGMRLLWEQTALPQHVRRRRLDVLHSPHYTMPLACSSRRVVTFHDATFFLFPELHEPLKRAFFPRVMHWTSRHADQVIAVSESTRRDILTACRLAADRIHTVHLAASPELVPAPQVVVDEVARRHGLVPGQYVLFVGVLEPRKNVPGLVDAFARIAMDTPDLVLAIVGRRGWMYDEIFARVAAARLEARVRFVDYVPDGDLPGLYGGARVFAYPTHYEGFGLPVLEAMQCGAPVLTSNTSSLPEVAGDAAILVDPSDVGAIADALRRIVSDHELARCLSERGKRQASRFTWDQTARKTLVIYRRAVAGDA
jgi:glycosyltransferase involved in cell wall biosynthesis